jgi:hypothetical protein
VRDCRNDLTGRHDSERLAVERLVGDQLIAKDTSGAGFIFNNHRFGESIWNRVGQYAADDVGAAAWSE